jgi:alkylation response protein AidB-like acyl-CoA dehydrogenase
MNFDLTEEQKMLAAEARKLLAARASANHLRELADAWTGWDPALWRAASEMGLLGAAIPEEFGGVGLGEIEVCVICEEMGRGPAPLPYVNTIGLAAEAIRLAGSDRQKSDWLPRLAAGEVVATNAWHEGTGEFDPGRLSAIVQDGRLSGRKSPLIDAQIAQIALVAATEDGAAGLYLVSLAQSEIALETLSGFDRSRLHATLTFTNAAAELLPGSSCEFIRAMEERAAIYTAFEQIGGAESCLFMARDYAMQRKTFGRAVGSYQAIKHKLADILLEIELARSNAYYAAWALATGATDLAEAAAVARLSAIAAYDLASRENLHVHGGFGYTWEADCHFHYRRARLLAACLGGPDIWSARLIAAMQGRAALVTAGGR